MPEFLSKPKFSVVFFVLVVLSALLLWDWHFTKEEMIVNSVFLCIGVVWILPVIAGLQAHQPDQPIVQPEHVHQAAKVWRRIAALSFFSTWLLMIVAILAFRHNWFDPTQVFAPIIEAAAKLFPPVRSLPERIAAKGFASRSDIVQVVAAIGTVGAMVLMLLTAYPIAAGLLELEPSPGQAAPKGAVHIMRLMFLLLFAYLCVLMPFFLDEKKGFFLDFPSSDLSLLFRFWILPAFPGILAGFVLGEGILRCRKRRKAG